MTPHQHLDYDGGTGALRWRARPRSDFGTDHNWKAWNKRYAGKPAGCKHEGKLQIHFAGRTWQCARLAWEMHHEVPVPDGMVVTFRNNDGHDIHIDNLEVTTRAARSRRLAEQYKPNNARWK